MQLMRLPMPVNIFENRGFLHRTTGAEVRARLACAARCKQITLPFVQLLLLTESLLMQVGTGVMHIQ